MYWYVGIDVAVTIVQIYSITFAVFCYLYGTWQIPHCIGLHIAYRLTSRYHSLQKIEHQFNVPFHLQPFRYWCHLAFAMCLVLCSTIWPVFFFHLFQLQGSFFSTDYDYFEPHVLQYFVTDNDSIEYNFSPCPHLSAVLQCKRIRKRKKKTEKFFGNGVLTESYSTNRLCETIQLVSFLFNHFHFHSHSNFNSNSNFPSIFRNSKCFKITRNGKEYNVCALCYYVWKKKAE